MVFYLDPENCLHVMQEVRSFVLWHVRSGYNKQCFKKLGHTQPIGCTFTQIEVLLLLTEVLYNNHPYHI